MSRWCKWFYYLGGEKVLSVASFISFPPTPQRSEKEKKKSSSLILPFYLCFGSDFIMSQNRQPRNPHLQSTTQTSQQPSPVLPGTLRLRGEETPSAPAAPSSSSGPRIRWSEDVVDNEGMGKKSSKGKITSQYATSCPRMSVFLTLCLVCCIYHKARPVGESSSESESSSSSSDSESDSDTDRRRPVSHHHRHSHPRGRQPAGEGSSDSNNHGADDCCSQRHHGRSKPKRKPSPNAYEKMPKPSKNSSRGA